MGAGRRRLLGLRRRPARLTRPFSAASSDRQLRAEAQTPDEMTKWLKDVGGQFKGTKIRYTSEATPPTVVLNQIKNEFTEPTGIEVEIEIVPLEQVLAKATQDVQGQLGTYDLYYLDQSWTATFAPDTRRSGAVLQGQARSRDAGLRLRRLLQAAGRRPRRLRRQVGRHSLRHPDLRHHVSQGHSREARHQAADQLSRNSPPRVKQITEAEKANGIFGTGLQAKSGHYSLECDWTQAVWGHGGSIFGKDKKFTGNDEQGVKGLQWYQEMLKNAPPQSTASTWDGQFQMMQSGQVALGQQLG